MGNKSKKSMLRAIAACMMMAIVFCMCMGMNVLADGVFTAGTGTITDPYQIETKEQLNAVRDNLKANYKLMNDIVFEDSDFEEGGAFYNEGQGWKPIGRYYLKTGYIDYCNCFSGIFDGNGHKIVNFKQNITIKDSQLLSQVGGLFDGVTGTIKNLKMENADVQVDLNKLTTDRKDGTYAILVSSNMGYVINCSTSGKLTVYSNAVAGGLVGYNEGLIANCVNTADISALYPTERDVYTRVGGIAGSTPGEIACCVNKGNIKIDNCTDAYAGGIAGGGQDTYYCVNEGQIESTKYAAGIIAMAANFKGYSCYNKGKVIGDNYAGGIVGEVDCAEMDQCYNVGSVSGNTIGGLVGKPAGGTLDTVVASNSYYSNEVPYGFAGKEYWEGMTSFDKSAISSRDIFQGFDFDNIWDMTEDGPILKENVFVYYKNHDKMYDSRLGKEYEGKLNDSWLKKEYYVGDEIDLSGALFSAKNTEIFVKGNQKIIDEEILYYTNFYDIDPIYLDDGTVYFEDEDGTPLVYICLIEPDELEVSGFDTSAPTTKKQTVTLKYYRFTATYKISVTERPHVHESDNGTIITNATCTANGSKEYKCTGCGECLRTETLLATGHKWNAGVVSKEPTETAEGEMTYTCTVCGQTKTEVIPKKKTEVQNPPKDETGEQNPTKDDKDIPKKGDVVSDDKASAKVEIADETKKEVEYQSPADKKAKTVTIPATVVIGGEIYKVTKIDDNAFKNNKTVTKVTVGSNIKTIGKNAFSGATKLKSIIVGKNVTEIGANAFKGCSSLTSISVPSKTTKIGPNAFGGCKKLKTITIKSTKLTAKTVSKNAFKGLAKTTTIKVPKKKLSAYKKLFKQKGLSTKVKVKGF